MSAIEILSRTRLRKVAETDLRQIYRFLFTASYDTNLPTIQAHPGEHLGFVLEIPNIDAGQALYCNVDVAPVSCLYIDETACLRMPMNVLPNCAGSLTMGISALGGGSASAELAALQALQIPRRFSSSNKFVDTYSQPSPSGTTNSYTGLALKSMGFGITGNSLTQEIYSHTELKYVVITCEFRCCLPEIGVKWYASEDLS